MQTFKALGALLDYPRVEIIEALDEIEACLKAEGLLAPAVLAGVLGLVDTLRHGDLLDLQEEYVALFDRTRSLSLHLYEHVHGESRDRGQAMVNLQSIYNLHGHAMNRAEMPDYLPMFCEFLSFVPEKAARSFLGDAVTVVEGLRAGLKKRGSGYDVVPAALVSLAEGRINQEELAQLLAVQTSVPDSLETLDAEWEEAAVTFGPGSAKADMQSGGCGINAGPPRS